MIAIRHFLEGPEKERKERICFYLRIYRISGTKAARPSPKSIHSKGCQAVTSRFAKEWICSNTVLSQSPLSNLIPILNTIIELEWITFSLLTFSKLEKTRYEMSKWMGYSTCSLAYALFVEVHSFQDSLKAGESSGREGPLSIDLNLCFRRILKSRNVRRFILNGQLR